MAEDDIYGNKRKFEKFKSNLFSFCSPPSKAKFKRKYFCRNKINLKYFEILFDYFDVKDLSYIRRNRILDAMKIIVHSVEIDLKECERSDVDKIVIFMHQRHQSPESKKTFLKDIKLIWRILFPEEDERGRVDETITPYPVRHLSSKISKSKQKLRKDKISLDEYHRVIDYFSSDPRIQAFLSIIFEWLSRPQELLYTRIRDVELHKGYAKIFISEHGKEGVKFVVCIDSYPYLLKWLEVHPFKSDEDSFLFVNTGNTKTGGQLTPINVNKKLKKACKVLKINKPLTCYSFKRNGVTQAKKNGDSDVEIQHKAGWTSTKQLQTYDLTTQNDALELTLKKKGIISDPYEEKSIEARPCPFCDEPVGFSDRVCRKCRHPLDKELAKSEKQVNDELESLKKENLGLRSTLTSFKKEILQELAEQIKYARPH